MLFEIAIVLSLTLVNGLLAMSELAIVSARPARLRILAAEGRRGAALAMTLAANPGRFLSSVQVGITLIGILSGAVSGATLGDRLSDALVAQGMDPGLAVPLGVGAVVACITYLSLVVGELVPKRIALSAPEAVAARVAPAMFVVARVASPLVWLLDVSGRLILRLLGLGDAGRGKVTDEEVKLLIAEAVDHGTLEAEEKHMIAGVMRIADRSARGLMTPRREVEVIDTAETREAVLARLTGSRRSRFPLRHGGEDDLVGVVAVRDVLAAAARGEEVDLRALAIETPVVMDSQGALDVLERLRGSAAGMAFVYDEYGHFEGIVTPMDLLEAITGSFADDAGDEPKIVERDDGSLIVAGWMPADEFADRIGAALDDDRDFETVAGLVLDRCEALPRVGDKVRLGPWEIEVMDLDGRRIDKVLATRKG